MKLYYTRGACSLAPHILINELNLPCEYESVDLKTKKTESGNDFWTINSKGSVPTLVTDENETLTENALILQYIADTHSATNLLPPFGDFKRYRVLEWVNFITTELHKGFSPLFNPTLSDDIKQEFFIPLIKKKLAYVNEYMQQPYLLGEEMTLPDIYLCVILFWSSFKMELTDWPNLNNFFGEIKKRPSVIKTFREEGLRLP